MWFFCCEKLKICNYLGLVLFFGLHCSEGALNSGMQQKKDALNYGM